MTDLVLYKQIVARMTAGESYYSAAAHAHRQLHYPLTPAVTVRPPTLATINWLLGPTGSLALCVALVVVAALVWHRRLEAAPLFIKALAAAIIAVVAGTGLLPGDVPYIHDWWAGILITIAVGLKDEWIPALIAATLAALIRDLAIPFLFVLALFQRNRAGRASLGVAVAICAAFYVMHVLSVHAIQRPGDLPSPGWFGLRGPFAFLNDTAGLTVLGSLGAFGYALIILSFIGWVRTHDTLAIVWISGVWLAVALIARENNFYWAQLTLPMLLLGLPLLLAQIIPAKPRPTASEI